MRLTAKELEQMKSVDIGAVAPESLPDVSGMTFDTSLPREERIALFLQAVENPYCFCIGGIGVKIEFAESGPSLQDTLTDFLLRQKSPGHTTLSSKDKIQYPHYPHIPQQSYTAKPSGTAAQFHSTFRSGNPDNPTSIASHITVSSYTAALSQCHFRSIIQSIPHALQHQEISAFRSVTHALVVSQQTHAVMFRLLLFYTKSCKIQRGFL